jgi:hypothetical protein
LCANQFVFINDDYQKTTSVGLGGIGFETVFGASKDDAPFPCREVCDGTTPYYSIQYGGPYACNKRTYVQDMKSDIGVDDNDVKACPVTIAPGGDDALKRAKMDVLCAACDTCGERQAVIVTDTAVWSLLEQMWGLGCARECSSLKCKESRIWDWTRNPTACVDCSELRDSRLCSQSDFTDEKLENYVVSGHMTLLYFEGCKGGAHELHEVTYGRCAKCEDSDKCTDPTYIRSGVPIQTGAM